MERTQSTNDVLDVFVQGVYVRDVPESKTVVKRRIGFFTGNERHEIPLEDGIKYTTNYRKSSRKFGASGTYFSREIIEKILGQERCVGIRIYYAKYADGSPTLVLTGTETNNADQYRGILGLENQSLASWTPSPNELNSDSLDGVASPEKTMAIFTGKENHFVTLAEAAELIRNYQESIQLGEIKGNFFGSGIFRKILSQDGCVGIHMYHAMHDDGSPSFVLVGVDAYGFDLLTGVVGQMVYPCPWFCDMFSPLNGSR